MDTGRIVLDVVLVLVLSGLSGTPILEDDDENEEEYEIVVILLIIPVVVLVLDSVLFNLVTISASFQFKSDQNYEKNAYHRDFLLTNC